MELTSSATLIRTLKSNTVPPLQKIQLAALAWTNSDLYFPAKREVLLEWLTTEIAATKQGGAAKGKGKGKLAEETVPTTPSVLSQLHWNLLVNLLPRHTASSSTSSSVPPSVYPLLTIFFRQLPAYPTALTTESRLLHEVAHAVRIITEAIPTAAEGLMDLLGEAFSCWEKVQSASDKHEVVEGWEVVLSALADGLELALPNNLARTKLSQTHLQTSLFSTYIHYLSLKPASSPLYVKLLNLQGSILFPPENLRIYLPPPTSNHSSKPRKQVRGLIGTQHAQAPPVVLSTSRDDTPTAPSSVIQTDDSPKLYKALSKLVETPESTGWVLNYLPHLLSAFTSILAVNRYALFPLPLNTRVPGEVYASEQISRLTLRFTRALKELVGDKGQKRERWACEQAVWEVLEERAKVGRGYQEGEDEAGWLGLGKIVLESGLGQLGDAFEDKNVDITDSILLTLTTILRLDRTLCDPFVPRLLVSISKMPPSAPSSIDLLDTLLTYHRQTRTLPSFIDLLNEAILSSPTPSVNYRTLASGPLFSIRSLDALSNALKGFLGVQGQMGELLRNLRLVLKDSVGSLENALRSASPGGEADGERKKKKRKVGGKGDVVGESRSSSAEIDEPAATLSLLSRLASGVIGSSGMLLVNSLPEGLLSSLRGDLEAILDEVAIPLINLGLHSPGGGNLWAKEMGLVAGLRIFEALRGVLDRVELGSEIEVELERVLRANDLGGEATIEVTRTYLRSSILNPSAEIRTARCSQTLGDILTSISKPSPTASWSGRLADLDVDGYRADSAVAVALWALLTGEEGHWLGVIDDLNQKPQLDATSSIIINSFSLLSNEDLSTHSSNGLFTLHSLTIATILKPQLSELANVRQSLLSSIDHLTSTLNPSPSSADTRPFELLLALPAEYTPRAQKTELLARAFRLEKALKLGRLSQDESWETRLRARALLRKLALELIKDLGVHGNLKTDEDIIDYLVLQSPTDDLHPSHRLNKSLEKSTLALLDVTFRSIVRKASSEGFLLLVNKLNEEDAQASLREMMDVEDPEDEEEDFSLDFSIKSRLVLLQVITEEVKDVEKIPSGIQLDLLVSPLQEALNHGFKKLHESFAVGRLNHGFADLVEALAITRMFESWMGSRSPGVELSPQELVKACLRFLASTKDFAEAESLVSAVLHLNVVDLQALRDPISKSAAGDVFVASWLALGSAFVARDQNVAPLSAPLLSFSKTLDSASRTSVLQTLNETVLGGGLNAAVLETSLLALNILLKEGSEISNRVVISKLITAAGEHIDDRYSWRVIAQATSILQTVCSDKASHLQMPDVDQLLAALSRAIAPRSKHMLSSSGSHPTLFRTITGSLTDLVRHRRDLVSSAPANLSALLCQLTLCFQTVRPNLGGRQVRTVEANLPGWIDPVSKPLGIEDARSLARLLSSLTAKTIPRLNTRTAAVKAESLAGPLSKHAPYVLLAYTRLLTDLNTVVSPSIRRELEPGVFAVCEIVGEKDRDSVMLAGGLDGGGKGILKMVWNAWEASRYVGKG